MSLKLLRKNCLLEPLPEKMVSDGGIHLPVGQVGDLKMYWNLAAAGADVPTELAVGSTVVTPLQFSHFTMEDGTGRKIVHCDLIIAKLETVPDLEVLPDV